MPDYSDLTVATWAVSNPATRPEELAQIAQAQPGLWPGVVYHPNAYPALLDWIAANRGPQAAATVEARRQAMWAAVYAYAPPVDIQRGKSGVQRAFDSMTGFEGKAIVRFKDLFRDTFKSHGRDDMEALLYAGTQAGAADRVWRLPWLYVRVFGVLIGAFMLLLVCTLIFSDSSGNVIPGVIFTGALVIPATVMIFFWEFNQAHNVSFFDVIRIFFIGGAMSILLTFVFEAPSGAVNSDSVGSLFGLAVMIGFTEELAKLVVVYILVRKLYGCLISNGLLAGAIVGAGFAVFETMGYGLSSLLTGSGIVRILVIRGILSIGGHVVWTAIAGAGLMFAQAVGSSQINLRTMSWGKLMALFAVPFVLHTLWDFFGFEVNSLALYYLLLAGLTVVAWIFVVRLINTGLSQYAAMLGGIPSVIQ